MVTAIDAGGDKTVNKGGVILFGGVSRPSGDVDMGIEYQ